MKPTETIVLNEDQKQLIIKVLQGYIGYAAVIFTEKSDDQFYEEIDPIYEVLEAFGVDQDKADDNIVRSFSNIFANEKAGNVSDETTLQQSSNVRT